MSEPATGLWALSGAAAMATEAAMVSSEAKRDIEAIPGEIIEGDLVMFLTCIKIHAQK
ncbi:hypothetical protein MASR1M101_16670 [Gemmatimonas sp.]